jgi:hypothetical protein
MRKEVTGQIRQGEESAAVILGGGNRNVYVWIINSAVRRFGYGSSGIADLVVDWGWVSSLSGSELLGVFACGAVIQRTERSLALKSIVVQKTYSTRFCVHCKSFCTSFAALMPSTKLACAPANRR